MSKFDELLASLQGEVEQQGELAKSLPAVKANADTTNANAGADEGEGNEGDGEEGEDDATIAAAAAEAGAGAGAAPAAKAEAFGKSFEFTSEDGSKHAAVDATDLVKSLMARQEETDGALTKALGSFTTVIKSQGEMIKSLTGQVAALAAQGRGRKTMVSISEKPALGDLQKSQAADNGMSTQEFFAKANIAFDAGKITGKDLNVISVSLRMNEAHTLDKSLVTKVLSA